MMAERLKIEEAAKILNMPENTLRLSLQQKLLPIGIAVKMEKEYSYYIWNKRLKKYLEGDLK